MPTSELVSDTGLLISFEKLPNGFLLLRRLCRRVLIPQQVLEELEAGLPGDDYLGNHAIGDLIQVAREVPLWRGPGAEDLDLGERAAIELAQRRALPLLIEERLGRRLAQKAGIPIAGAAGLILMGHRRREISPSAARQALMGLRAAGRIGAHLLEELLVTIL